MSIDLDCIVMGAGVVGLACARALALSGRDVVVVDPNYNIGMETSSRNSEVVHSGIYYPTGSLKAEACVKGRDLLYAYCDSHHVPYAKLGKLIVATSTKEQAEIERLLLKGTENGVDDLEVRTAAEVTRMEPEVACMGALWSPSTGIVDSHAFMIAMRGDLEDQGGMIAFDTRMTQGEIVPNGLALRFGDDAPLTARLVINSTGLHAPDMARLIDGYDDTLAPTAHYARGVYFGLSGRSPFSHLIYPAPEPGGLGVHATLDLSGQCRFGPDVEWVDEIDYTVDPVRGDIFYDRIRKYWPGLKDGQLVPDYAGIRPKIVGPDEPAGDFVIQGADAHRCAHLINLFGIESPGLTSSLALAERVAAMADRQLG